MEKFNFTKEEDRERFDALDQEKKDKIIEEGHDKALIIDKNIFKQKEALLEKLPLILYEIWEIRPISEVEEFLENWEKIPFETQHKFAKEWEKDLNDSNYENLENYYQETREAIVNIIEQRKEAGYENFPGYHVSGDKHEIGQRLKFSVRDEGKNFYAKNKEKLCRIPGMKYIYIVDGSSTDNMYNDHQEWFKSNVKEGKGLLIKDRIEITDENLKKLGFEFAKDYEYK